MLERFSYMYKEVDIENYWYMQCWPLKIQECVTAGKNIINEKNDHFSAKLETEKETFIKQIVLYQEQFEKIKLFTNVAEAQDIYYEASQLHE